jgi:protein ImuB
MKAESELNGRLTKAPTKKAKRRTGRAARAVNSDLPTPGSDLPIASILAILHKWGIHTLGQLAALDKEELRARLGTDAVRLWERANGTATRLLKFVQPPESFDESFEFDHEIETAEPLLFMLRRFLEQLALRLSAIYLVAKELTLVISFSNSRQDESAAVDQQSYERVFKIPQPTNDVDLLFRMLQTHLENFKSEHPIVAVALTAQPIRPASQQFGLFETALRNPQQLYETLARLSALLGSDRVGTPIKEETHRPDAFRMEPFSWTIDVAPSSSPSPRNGESPSRTGTIAAETAASTEKKSSRVALRRFRPAAAASIFTSQDRSASRPTGSWLSQPAGSPSSFYLADYEQRVISFEGAACVTQVRRHLQSDKIHGQVIDQSGPFLLSGNWWDEKSWARAEWDMQLENGDLIRAHEDPPCISAAPAALDRVPLRLYRPCRSSHSLHSQGYGVTGGTWKVDGIYD